MRKLSKKIIINSGIFEDRVAILDHGKLDEFSVEQGNAPKIFGNIYKGIVESVLPGIGAAFVNIGTGKNGFLHVSDIQSASPLILEEADDYSVEHEKKYRNSDITNMLKSGQEILVQVGKESIGTKGPRLTTYISIPGRHIVLTPFDNNIGISKRISDLEERNRIREIIKQAKLPQGVGCIVRTAARGMSANTFNRELKYLVNLWMQIRARSLKARPPAAVNEEFGLILRIMRDYFTEDVESVKVDSKEEYRNIVRFVSQFMPMLKPRVHFYNERVPIFEKYGIESEIEKLFQRKISLRNGGSIIIEQTEGMVAIDVNTERYIGRQDAEETIFKTNLEAAKEIARQVRLRDIGGIIVMDFIDMNSKDHRMKVQATLEAAMEKDKAKTNILNISTIGVIEMTRQRVRKSLESSMYKDCPHCRGRGRVKSETTIAMEMCRKIEKAAGTSKARKLHIFMNPLIYDFVIKNAGTFLAPLKRKVRKNMTFDKDDKLMPDEVRIV